MAQLGLNYHRYSGKQGWYGSPSQLQRQTKLPLKKVKEYLASQDSYTLNRRIIKKFPRRVFFSPSINHCWQSDITQLPGTKLKKGWRGTKYFLTCIDVLSRFARVVPIPSKDGQTVAKAFETFLSEGIHPQYLQTDQGKEFISSQFQNLMKKYNIHWYYTFTGQKTAICERFHRTFFTRMFRYFSATAPAKRLPIKILTQKIVDSYNNSYHRSIGRSPASVNEKNQAEVKKLLYGKQKVTKPVFKIGDVVRLAKKDMTFQKGYQKTFKKDLFTIAEIKKTKPTTYILKDSKEILIKGGFYAQELIKIKV